MKDGEEEENYQTSTSRTEQTNTSNSVKPSTKKTLGDTKVIGPLLIGLGLPIEIAPLRTSVSEIINLASIAAYSADVIDYKNN